MPATPENKRIVMQRLLERLRAFQEAEWAVELEHRHVVLECQRKLDELKQTIERIDAERRRDVVK